MNRRTKLWMACLVLVGLTVSPAVVTMRAQLEGNPEDPPVTWQRWDEQCPGSTKQKTRCFIGGAEQCTARSCS